MDLKVSNNVIHLRTCADSCSALARLLLYLATDGDLAMTSGLASPKSSVIVAAEPTKKVGTILSSVLLLAIGAVIRKEETQIGRNKVST